jgi:hypothetical protein
VWGHSGIGRALLAQRGGNHESQISYGQATYREDVRKPRRGATVISIITESDDISIATRTMVSRNVRRLPVVNDEGAMVGIISMVDFAISIPAQARLGCSLQP